MPEIKIKGIPQELVDKIDNLTSQSSYHDRSAFLIAALNEYCLYHDNYFLQSLPDTTRILVEDTLKKGSRSLDQQLQFTLQTNRACVQIMQKILAVLNGDENDTE